jgi:hypothetical protein
MCIAHIGSRSANFSPEMPHQIRSRGLMNASSKATEGIARPVFDCASGWFFAIHPHARCASLVYRNGWWSHSSGTLRETPH